MPAPREPQSLIEQAYSHRGDEPACQSAHPAPAEETSENVILSSPMSFTGSARRIMRHRPQDGSPARQIAATIALVLAVAVAWGVIAVWYTIMFSVWLLPTIVWRFHRRNVRREHAATLRHRELLGTLKREDR